MRSILTLALMIISVTMAYADIEILFYMENNVLKCKLNGHPVNVTEITVDQDLIFKADRTIADGCSITMKSRAPGAPFTLNETDCSKIKNGGLKVSFSSIKAALDAKKLGFKFNTEGGVIDLNFKPKGNQPRVDPRTNDDEAPDPVVCKIHKPGIAYYDALALLHPERYALTNDSWDNIIRYYFPKFSGSLHNDIVTNLKAEADSNKLLNGIQFNDPNNPCGDNKGANSKTGDMVSASLRSLGNTDVTTIADGIAKFLVKRTKEELSLSFFIRFRDVISDKKYEELQVLFPKTYSLLLTMGDEVYDYKRYIQNLREAFKHDIRDLNRNMPKITETQRGLAFFKEYPDLKAVLLSACYISQELDLEAHPGDVLANYPLEILSGTENQEHVRHIIQTLQLVSTSLRDSSMTTTRYWINTRQLREFVNEKQLLRVYLGLLVQQLKNDNSTIAIGGTKLIDILESQGSTFNGYDKYRSFIAGFTNKAQELDRLLGDDKPTTDSLRIERDARYFRATVELIEYSTQVALLPGIETAASSRFYEATKDYFKIAYTTTDLVLDINRKNYSAAINDAVFIYNYIVANPPLLLAKVTTGEVSLPEAKAKKVSKHLRQVEKITAVPIADSTRKELLTKSTTDFKPSESSRDVLNKLVQYGSFMATVSTAKTSDEVEAAIEAFALPTGSARVKRDSRFNVSLNAYVGAFYGSERIRGAEKTSDPHKHFNSYGITAPIGVSISKGQLGSSSWKRPFSVSLFFSVIDLGAITSFRFRDAESNFGQDTTVNASDVPVIKLKDIISPGVFLSIGIPKSPISVNLGVQGGPNLRHVDVSKNNNNIPDLDFSSSQYIRYSFSICVDIPIVNFYTKSTKTKQP